MGLPADKGVLELHSKYFLTKTFQIMASLFLMQANAYTKNSGGLSGNPKCLRIHKANKTKGDRDR